MLKSYHQQGLILILLRPRSRIPLVKWKDNRLSNDDFLKFLTQHTNWAIRCDDDFPALDFDTTDAYTKSIPDKGELFKRSPILRTGRGHHVWLKPKRRVNSFSRDGFEEALHLMSYIRQYRCEKVWRRTI